MKCLDIERENEILPIVPSTKEIQFPIVVQVFNLFCLSRKYCEQQTQATRYLLISSPLTVMGIAQVNLNKSSSNISQSYVGHNLIKSISEQSLIS